MPRWMKPTEDMPECEAGDRILCIVAEVIDQRVKPTATPRLVILEATETGWESPDPTYGCYTVEDCILWSYERDVCQIAYVAYEGEL